MDFAFDFQSLNAGNEINMNMKRENMINNSNFANQNNPNNQSSLIKLSLENDVFKNKQLMNQQLVSSNNSGANNNQLNAGMQTNNYAGNIELDKLTKNIINLKNNLKVVSKKVEIVTKIVYTFEDGSTKIITQNETHEFKG
jgi:hypothetical protein